MNTAADVLALVVAHVESQGNPYAMRFEPAVHEREDHQRLYGTLKDGNVLGLIRQANSCNIQTAEVIYSTSWGMYQIMGFNLYAQGWIKSIGSYLSNSAAQSLSFTRYLQRKNLPFTWDELKNNNSALEHFASEYNGPADVDEYMKRLVEAARVLNV